MRDFVTPSERLTGVDPRVRRRLLLTVLIGALLVLLLVVVLPTRDARGAGFEHYRGVRSDGAAYNCWNVRRSPLLEFCVFYPSLQLARR